MKRSVFLNVFAEARRSRNVVIEFDGIRLNISKKVYEPHEDSFLLAKAVSKYAGGKVLDVGCGSGIQSIVAARKRAVWNVVGVDVSEKALDVSEENAELNGVGENCYFIQSNLFSGIGKNEGFDTIVFNPPYLPTDPDEVNEEGVAWDGGSNGRKVIERFLNELEGFLKPRGILLTIGSSLSNNGKTIRTLKKKGFRVEIVGEEKFFFEKLTVVKAQKIF
ncbi:methyltransferase [Candidatus Micrarchaeota archaeon]|nr:methyltransferase [Candidatus Micrarchaeota archaeon]